MTPDNPPSSVGGSSTPVANGASPAKADTHFDPLDLIEAGAQQALGSKTWSGHDRNATVGASEVGHCMRAVVYLKHGAKPDPWYTGDWGALERGNAMEAWAVDRMQKGLAGTDRKLIWATDEGQTTIVSAYQHATPDGMFIAGSTPMTFPHPVDPERLVSAALVYNELKSIDPRIYDRLSKPKHEHVCQVQQGMDLVRKTYPEYQVEWACITYINASFYHEKKRYFVEYDPGFAARLRKRAQSIMLEHDLTKLPLPEGKIGGGKECDTCPYDGQCRRQRAGSVPTNKTMEVTPKNSEVLTALRELCDELTTAQGQLEGAEAEKSRIEHDIMETMKSLNTRKVTQDWGGVTVWKAMSPGRIDEELMRADGLDPTKYKVEGKPYTRVATSRKAPAT